MYTLLLVIPLLGETSQFPEQINGCPPIATTERITQNDCKLFMRAEQLKDHDIRDMKLNPKTTELYLAGNEISDNSVETITKKLPHLRKLELSNNKITDQSALHISRLTKLEYLDLSNTKISNESLKILKTSNIKYFIISNTNIDYAGIKILSTMKLEHLNITGTHTQRSCPWVIEFDSASG